jgi:hypothetical protein
VNAGLPIAGQILGVPFGGTTGQTIVAGAGGVPTWTDTFTTAKTFDTGANTPLLLRNNNNVASIDIYVSSAGTADQRRVKFLPFVSAGTSRLEVQRVTDAGVYQSTLLSYDLTGAAAGVAIGALYVGALTPTSAVAGNGIIQFASSTTKAGGLGFSDVFGFRFGAGNFRFQSVGSGFWCELSVMDAAGVVDTRIRSSTSSGNVGTQTNHSFILVTNNTTAITIDATQKVTFAGNVGFNGTTAIAKPTAAASATDAATTQTLANSLRTILINYGLAA